MATLNERWAAKSDITRVAVRPNGIYVAMGHETPDDAVKAAAEAQAITIDDIMAADWREQEAP